MEAKRAKQEEAAAAQKKKDAAAALMRSVRPSSLLSFPSCCGPNISSSTVPCLPRPQSQLRSMWDWQRP